MRTSFALFTSALLLGGLPVVTDAKVDAQRMQRDVRIAEDILRALIDSPVDEPPLVSPTYPRVHGVYIEDYGVVFLAEGSLSDEPIVEHLTRTWVDQEGRQHVEKTRRGTAESRDGEVKPVRAALSEFLSDYAGAIDGLDDDARIAVLYRTTAVHSPGDRARVDVDVRVGSPGAGGKDMETELTIVKIGSDDGRSAHIDTLETHLPPSAVKRQIRVVIDTLMADDHIGKLAERLMVRPRASAAPAQTTRPSLISASAQKGDIDERRRGKIDSAAFSKRIQFELLADTGNKKIALMAGIIAASLRHPAHGTRPAAVASGAHQPGLGAIFSLDMRPPLPPHRLPAAGPAHHHRANDSIAQWKEALVETMGKYGATLHGVAAEESVFVDVRLPPGHAEANRLLMRVEKSAIDAYTQGKIDRTELATRTVWRLW